MRVDCVPLINTIPNDFLTQARGYPNQCFRPEEVPIANSDALFGECTFYKDNVSVLLLQIAVDGCLNLCVVPGSTVSHGSRLMHIKEVRNTVSKGNQSPHTHVHFMIADGREPTAG